MNAYELAYEYVQHTNRCIFLTGKAGTGKTTFLRRLKQECPKQLTVVAPTGVAAINAEGVTIHSLFQLPPQVFLPTPEARKQLFSEMQMRAQKQRILRNLELLVIDEVSMVRSDLLDTIDAVLRHVKHRPNHPFGGVQVLFIGDLFQLSPVAREQEWRLMQPYYEGAYFFQAQVFRELRPVYIELDHVFRQTNSDFVEILNQVRNNTLTQHSLQLLNSRYIPDFEPSKQREHYITLSTHNSKVDAINLREMEALDAKSFSYHARVKDTFPESLFPMDQTLILKVGARVMFIKNDSSQDKLYYNGKLGVVTSLTKDAINVTCEDGTVIDVHQETWENLRYTSETGSDTITTEVIGTFSHYPLRLAWAITIHKAQGLTFERVVIDAEDAFAAGQVYVALSRCRTLDGIVLRTPIPNRALTNAREVLYFTNNQSDTQTTESLLPASQVEYLVVLLCILFDFRSVINRFAGLSRVVKNMDSIQGDASKFFTTCIGGLEGLQVIAERFQQQLRHIIYTTYQTASPSPSTNNLHDRLTAASGYFSPKIKLLLNMIEACPLRTNDRTDAAYFKQNITDLYADIARLLYMIEQMAKASSHATILSPHQLITAFFTVRQNFKLVDPNLTVHATSRKLRSDSTAFKTLQCFYDGLTIKQIAKKRKLTVNTVVKHLRFFLNNGLIRLTSFSPADQDLLEV